MIERLMRRQLRFERGLLLFGRFMLLVLLLMLIVFFSSAFACALLCSSVKGFVEDDVTTIGGSKYSVFCLLLLYKPLYSTA